MRIEQISERENYRERCPGDRSVDHGFVNQHSNFDFLF